MARLEGKVPGFDKLDGESYEDLWERHSRMVTEMSRLSDGIDPDGPSLKGALIRFSVADGYALYVVSKGSPLTLQHVPYGDAYQADPATVRGTNASTVRAQLRQRRAALSVVDESEVFYSKLEIGQIVHYRGLGRGFTRCEVVDGSGQERNQAGKCLKPVALVGNWHPSDLPKRRPTGEVVLGYSAEAIAEGHLICPHSSCLYEGMSASSRSRHPDPTGLPAIDLGVRPMTPEEEVHAELCRRISRIRSIIDYPGDPAEILEEVAKVATRAA